jgi:hypothetical protein
LALKAGVTYTYTGRDIVVSRNDVTLTVGGAALSSVGNWTISSKGKLAGSGASPAGSGVEVTITGIGAYAGSSLTDTFEIVKKPLTVNDFTTSPGLPAVVTPTAANDEITGSIRILPVGSYTGIGAATFTAAVYGDTGVTLTALPGATIYTFTPPNVGSDTLTWSRLVEDSLKDLSGSGSKIGTKYDIYAAFAEGANFTSKGKALIGTYTVKDPNTTELPADVLSLAAADREKTITYGDTLKLTKPTIPVVANGTLRTVHWVIKDKNAAVVADVKDSLSLTVQMSIYPRHYEFKVSEAPYTVTARCSSTVSGTGKIGYIDIKVNVNRKQLDTSNVQIAGTYSYLGRPVNAQFTVVKKGTTTIIPSEQWVSRTDVVSDQMQAGTGWVRIEGQDNYYGTVDKSFTITKAPLTLNRQVTVVDSREYNGSDVAAASLFNLTFEGLQGEEALVADSDFVVKGGKFSQANAGTGLNVTGTVELVAAGPVAKNYSLASDAGALSLPGAGTILRTQLAEPDSFFTYTIPKNHYFKNARQGLGAVAYKAGITNGTGTFKLLYRYAGEGKGTAGTAKTVLFGDPETAIYPMDSSAAPAYTGTYKVLLALTPGTNFDPDVDTVVLGDYEIKAELPPVIVINLDSAYSAMETVPKKIGIVATPPINGGSLTYQWYSAAGDPVVLTKLTGQTRDSLSVPNSPSGTTLRYAVEVINTSTAQITTRDTSLVTTVTFKEAPIYLSNRNTIIELNPDTVYTYTGKGIEPAAGVDGDVKVTYYTVSKEEPFDTTFVPLTVDVDYRLTYNNNINAGDKAVINVSGLLDSAKATAPYYGGFASTTFEIVKADIGMGDLVWVGTREWSPVALGAEIDFAPGKTGFGAITTKYDGASAIPSEIGFYPLTIDVAAGTNYNKVDNLELGMYRIMKKTIRLSDLEYDTVKVKAQRFTGEDISVGTVSVKASVGTGYGKITVLYNGMEDLPVELGSYTVTLEVEGGDNFEETTVFISTLVIYDHTNVSEIEREVPSKPAVIDTVAVVAPVVKPAVSFIAGPNPAKSGSAVKFFYSGKSVKGGTILVYASTGKLVKKVAVTGGVGEVASWTASVPAGTYIAKGVLNTESGKEKVSALILVK